MGLYRDEGVVLRTQKLGEADRIITILTREHGRVRAVGKGVRRTGSKFGARLEPFMHVDLQLHTGRSLDIVTQAVTLTPYAGVLGADYGRYTAGTAMLEAVERLTDAEQEPAVQQYLLLLGALRALAGTEHDPGLVLDAFLLRSLAIAGYAPTFDACARCGLMGPHGSFAVAAGGSLCPDCTVPGAAHPSPAVLVLLGALLTGDWETADGSEERARREGHGLTAAYLNWHLERGLRSLRLVERV
ncbi:DNA replication and repair protein RecO [Motilibacter rhizosphaerae]|uniref:DNA repair protein RecO n=1 Tax=Motilibacter rhizosphaerae TaxID=598652 RepID=A0A4Q7NRN7_9ACTN|nr:DNA repair protein RecO [Motilibacter rhizosphaerae]RZS89721.1 DNA replication and repair protein RecO [Motilibacter rhizosphaerae]